MQPRDRRDLLFLGVMFLILAALLLLIGCGSSKPRKRPPCTVSGYTPTQDEINAAFSDEQAEMLAEIRVIDPPRTGAKRYLRVTVPIDA